MPSQLKTLARHSRERPGFGGQLIYHFGRDSLEFRHIHITPLVLRILGKFVNLLEGNTVSYPKRMDGSWGNVYEKQI